MGFKNAGKPHYLGHRERLGRRFREAGADALPDYELLELILFRAAPRRDTKPLAKAILARFGTFAEALNAPEELLAEVPGIGEAAEFVIWGSGTPRREFLHVDDAADALTHLMKHYSGDSHVNVGSGSDLSILELAELIARVAESAQRVVLAFLVPWLILYCPILVWTWVQSGSPFGPILAGSFGSSVYPLDWIRETFEGTRQANQPDLLATACYAGLEYSPIVWVGALGAIFATDLPRATRVTLGVLFGFQLILIYLLLPHDPRFLGGILQVAIKPG